ncbi:MAG: BrxE family protein [Rhodobacteraceae bacterium]|nr:BrxE family protein [Paracoccaceae bacterium]
MNSQHEQMLTLPVIVHRLRALVLALGESGDSCWWKTEFMNETGLRFLERLYPRTFFSAAIHAAGEAACNAHDRAVGRVGVYHLFRLPEFVDVELNHMPFDADMEFLAEFRAALSDTGKLMEMLARLCGESGGVSSVVGARRIGNEKDMMTCAAFKAVADDYHRAFMRGYQVFPYFAAEDGAVRG